MNDSYKLNIKPEMTKTNQGFYSVSKAVMLVLCEWMFSVYLVFCAAHYAHQEKLEQVHIFTRQNYMDI